MKKICVSAPGKIHLLGEHAVVYNKPAIIASVNKRCFVEISSRTDGIIKITSQNYKKEINTNFKDLIKKFQKAQEDWEIYDKTNDIKRLKTITKDQLDYPLIIIGEFLNFYKLDIDGFNLLINSEIPVGAGMGSSGALSVAIIGALSLLANKSFDRDAVNKIAFLAEQKKHGKPSGGDNTTCCFGGFIWFKKDEGMKRLDLSLSSNISKNFYVINTGTPLETTGEMVGLVRNLIEKKPEYTEKIFDSQEKLVHKLLTAIKTENTNLILDCLRNGEQNLEKLGVVSEYVKSIIRQIEKIGGGAKICGGGGITKGTGVLLVFHEKPALITQICSRFNLSYSKITLGVEGVREEVCKK